MPAARVHIGTSGWNYPEWKDSFYAGIRQRDWLKHCAQVFTGLEVDATFYRQMADQTLERWRDETGPDFRFAIKAHRYMTHVMKLRFDDVTLQRQKDNARHLGEKLAVVLWQLPMRFKRDMAKLQRFADQLGTWQEVRHALEVRDQSWFDGQVAALLREHRLAVCQSDAADWPLWDAVTTDLVYIRLHGHTRTYESEYGADGLAPWAKRIKAWRGEGREVHVYFDNTAGGHAPRDALRLIAMIR